jgi:hypothetical protein
VKKEMQEPRRGRREKEINRIFMAQEGVQV